MAADKVKFKVGDRVRVVVDSWRSDSGHCAQAGDVYVVTAVDSEGVNTNLWWFANHEIEPVAAAPLQQPLTIRAGRYYKTRDGRKVGPMKKWANGHCGFTWESKGYLWKDDGENYDKGSEHTIIAEWTDEPASSPTTGFTVPLDAPEFGGGEARFKVGDRVHYKDDYCEGIGVIHSDNDAANGCGWFVTVEEKDCDHAPFDGGTTRVFPEDKLRLVAEATSGKEDEPDTRLLVAISADTSALDAEIDRVLKRLRKLKKKARKLGISLEYSELRDAA